ncbi:hypothetical protein D9619_004760 [Psilocybe cf. subviscida]|uniref:DUF6535 domain-containing protein n=1 Tax=Psilocybe cf. subviscida TaxID=2480587 RepID=A0A8H5BQK8_9AGAR|nr:hypothetical protein D9619_004760 [Psilocybe cf. subviscida]
MWDNTGNGKTEIPKPPGDPWRICLEPLLLEDRAKCEAWRDEMQNLLIFAGLFSAVVTAFVIQSCQDLQPDNGNQAVNLLATLLSSQTMMSGSTEPTIINPASIQWNNTLSLEAHISKSTVRVNVCWLTSLILSLITVLIGIVSLQWIREYQNYPTNLSPKRAFATRNLRYEGLHNWLVPELFASLPLLLQTAVALFLVGLADFLIHLNVIVAIPAVALTAVTLTFLLLTTMMPALQALWMLNIKDVTSIPSQCPYKSPQSWAFLCLASSHILRTILITGYDVALFLLFISPLRTIYPLFPSIRAFIRGIKSYLGISATLQHLGPLKTWNAYDGFWLDGRQRLYIKPPQPSTYFPKMGEVTDCDAARGVAHVVDGRAQDEYVAISVYHCFQELPTSVIRDDIFDIMTRRLQGSLPQTSSQTGRKCYLLADSDTGLIRSENEMLLLGRLPQTTQAYPLHAFRRRQLQLFVKLLSQILIDSSGTRLPCESPTHRGQHATRKRMSMGRLVVPACLKTVEALAILPERISEDIKQDLIHIFDNLMKKSIAVGNEDYETHACFYEETAGDFMQLMQVITMSILNSSQSAAPSDSQYASRLAQILNTLNREVMKRSRTSKRCVVYLSILYVSRFRASDWPTLQRASEELSAAFQDLVESLNTLGLSTFNFALGRTFYQAGCKALVKAVLTAGQLEHLSVAPQCVTGGRDLVIDMGEYSKDLTHNPHQSPENSRACIAKRASWGITHKKASRQFANNSDMVNRGFFLTDLYVVHLW